MKTFIGESFLWRFTEIKTRSVLDGSVLVLFPIYHLSWGFCCWPQKRTLTFQEARCFVNHWFMWNPKRQMFRQLCIVSLIASSLLFTGLFVSYGSDKLCLELNFVINRRTGYIISLWRFPCVPALMRTGSAVSGQRDVTYIMLANMCTCMYVKVGCFARWMRLQEAVNTREVWSFLGYLAPETNLFCQNQTASPC